MTTYSARTAAEWRDWLAAHSGTEREIWLVIQRKDSPVPSVGYGEAIEQALCFGWIDSHARKHDATSFRLRFTPRRPGSNWSRVNQERAARMIEQGLMTERGQEQIDLAKARGAFPDRPVSPEAGASRAGGSSGSSPRG